jgi:hypothetical protein
MTSDKSKGRPISNNVDYFPHKCKDDKELLLIHHKYKSEGYEAFYRLQQSLGDAEFHRIDLKNDIEKEMFEMCMCVSKKVLYGVIDILIGMNWLDKEIYEKDNVLWSDKFVNSVRAVYINRRKQVPSKDDIYRVSTCKNERIVEYSIEKDRKEKKSREEGDSLLSVKEYEDLFPEKDIKTSYEKLIDMNPSSTHSKAMKWFEQERRQKPKQFRISATGGFIAYCSKCRKKEFPNDKFHIKQGSNCCRVEYDNE